MTRLVLGGLIALVLSSCGSVAVSSSAKDAASLPAPSQTSAVPAGATAVPSPSPVGPQPTAPSPTSAPALAPPVRPAPLPPVPPAPVAIRMFGLVPVGGSMTSGSILVQPVNGLLRATLSARGLLPGTVHTVHIHLGTCANPYGGLHLTVLGLMFAASDGTGFLSAPIAPVYLSSGHYLIVYANNAPQRIIACANL